MKVKPIIFEEILVEVLEGNANTIFRRLHCWNLVTLAGIFYTLENRDYPLGPKQFRIVCIGLLC